MCSFNRLEKLDETTFGAKKQHLCFFSRFLSAFLFYFDLSDVALVAVFLMEHSCLPRQARDTPAKSTHQSLTRKENTLCLFFAHAGLWLQLLLRVPGSVLWLYEPEGAEPDATPEDMRTRTQLLASAAAVGIKAGDPAAAAAAATDGDSGGGAGQRLFSHPFPSGRNGINIASPKQARDEDCFWETLGKRKDGVFPRRW